MLKPLKSALWTGCLAVSRSIVYFRWVRARQIFWIIGASNISYIWNPLKGKGIQVAIFFGFYFGTHPVRSRVRYLWLVNQSLTSKTFWLVYQSKPSWPVKEIWDRGPQYLSILRQEMSFLWPELFPIFLSMIILCVNYYLYFLEWFQISWNFGIS